MPEMYGNEKAYFQSSMVRKTGYSIINKYMYLKFKDAEFYYIVYMYVVQANLVSLFLFYIEKL